MINISLFRLTGDPVLAQEIYLSLRIHSRIMAAGDSGIPVHWGSCWVAGGMLLLLNPPKADVPPVATEEFAL